MQKIADFSIEHPATDTKLSDRGVPQIFVAAAFLIIAMFCAMQIPAAGTWSIAWITACAMSCVLMVVFGIWFYKVESAFEKYARTTVEVLIDSVAAILLDDESVDIDSADADWIKDSVWGFLTDAGNKKELARMAENAPALILVLESDDERKVSGVLYKEETAC